MSEIILEVKNLAKKFPVYGVAGRLAKPIKYVNAIDNITFSLNKGETYGLVGESGSGKTTTGSALLRLVKADSGEIIFNKEDILKLSHKEFSKYRKDIQMIFQDPFSSLNPRKTIGQILEEPLIIHKMGNTLERREKVFNIINTVGLQQEHYFRYPHEFSGGQRQRVGIARTIITNPKIIICDEPVSALDVSVQSQILNLLKYIQKEFGITFMFISHDISVVKYISHRIGVMYLGRIVEEGTTEELFTNPMHPYTRALFSAVPQIGRERVKVKDITGEISKENNIEEGCTFYNRCPKATSICKDTKVPETNIGWHRFFCHNLDCSEDDVKK
ncbi:MAG: ABC transporter ATP-binding protein [Lachnospirales bacterium]